MLSLLGIDLSKNRLSEGGLKEFSTKFSQNEFFRVLLLHENKGYNLEMESCLREQLYKPLSARVRNLPEGIALILQRWVEVQRQHYFEVAASQPPLSTSQINSASLNSLRPPEKVVENENGDVSGYNYGQQGPRQLGDSPSSGQQEVPHFGQDTAQLEVIHLPGDRNENYRPRLNSGDSKLTVDSGLELDLNSVNSTAAANSDVAAANFKFGRLENKDYGDLRLGADNYYYQEANISMITDEDAVGSRKGGGGLLKR